MTSTTQEIFSQVQRLLEESNLPQSDRDYLAKLAEILATAVNQDSKFKLSELDTQTLVKSMVDNNALFALLRQQAAELNALKKLSLNLTSSLDLPTVLDAVVSEAMNLVKNARSVHIFLYDAEKKLLIFGAALNNLGVRDRAWSEPRRHGLTYTVAEEGELVLVEDMSDHPLYADAPPEWTGSIVGIPLKMGGKVVGVMNLSRTTPGAFSGSELRLLQLLADQAAIAIINARLHEKVSRQAYSDTVTGLPNRRALDERLEDEVRSARRTGRSFAVVMMDLDGFKDVNDTYGHSVGDRVLRLTFSFLAQGLRNSDFLARYGGDELTLVMSKSDLSAAILVAQKLGENLRNFMLPMPDHAELHLQMTGGIAVYPIHASTSAGLLRAADEALYRAKKHQRGQFLIARGLTAPLPKLEE